MDHQGPSLQERYAKTNRCFGCGPANEHGLRLRSFEDGDSLVCTWHPEPYHEAFPGMLNGGIVGTLLDCHSNWAAAWHLLHKTGAEELPSTVTAEFHVRLKKPTPSGVPVNLKAWVTESSDRKAVIEAELFANDELTATCTGIFVAVREGHAAYHRWR